MIYKYTIICLMALIFLFVIHLLIVNINFSEVLSQESDDGAPKTPSGLYVATDKVALLTVNNFNENVYNSTSAWLVQFYNSWCGHCIKFSPIWKQLAASIYSKCRSAIIFSTIVIAIFHLHCCSLLHITYMCYVSVMFHDKIILIIFLCHKNESKVE